MFFFIIYVLLFITVIHSEFTCTEKGRFKDDTNLDCQRYFLCSPKKNGGFAQTLYNCPNNSYFDSELGFCTSDAICGKTTELSTVKPTTPPTSTPQTTEAPQQDIIIPSFYNYTCQSEGRFPDFTVCDCGWFYQCKQYEGYSNYTRLYCPVGTKFNPKTSSCTSVYTCPEEFVCERKGLFADVQNASNYYECEVMVDGSFFQTHYACSEGLVFIQDVARCIYEVTTKVATESSTQNVNSPTELPTTLTDGGQATRYNCTINGRFIDPKDDLCKGYYLCMDHQAFRYTCPQNLQFDPKIQECSDSYQCPFEVVTESWKNTFSCKKRGYFKNYDDLTSKAYHLCDVLGDGLIYQFELMCPAEYVFNDETNLCKK